VPIVGVIKGNSVSVRTGDLTKLQADAYVVPQFTDQASFAGVGGAVARAGGERGLARYEEHLLVNGDMRVGEAFLARSGGGNADCHLHVASLVSDRKGEFGVVHTAFYNALRLAIEHGIGSIAAPALGTGTGGHLTPEQSAKAMMGALDRHATEGKPPVEVTFVIFGDEKALAAFSRVLSEGLYEGALPEAGAKEIDGLDWHAAQIRDQEANRRAGIEGDGGLLVDDDGELAL
jgi:O-acetyl-ADP-ribose deacetylase (regulator of RNase III)